MNQSELDETINGSKKEVWEVLFTEYGDIHTHNPTMNHPATWAALQKESSML